jgi:signal peptidase I
MVKHPSHSSFRRAGCGVASALVLVLAGCGDSGSSSSSTPPTGSPGSQLVASGADGASKSGGSTGAAPGAPHPGEASTATAPNGVGTVSGHAPETGGGGESAPSGQGGHGHGQSQSQTKSGGKGGSLVNPKGKSRPESRSVTGGGSSGGGPAGLPPNAQNGVPFEVKTTSMEPTYKSFSTVYYNPTATHPQIGQVIVLYYPVGVESGECASKETGGRACAAPAPGLTHVLSIKRVVGLPGEQIAVHNGWVVRNGQLISQPNIVPCGEKERAREPGCEYPTPITVPANSYYVMSDDRKVYQEDSRSYGAVPQSAVVGTVLGS